MIRALLSLYSWKYPAALVYMLQSTEYQAGAYLKWYWRTNDFSQVTYRRVLNRTRPAQLLLQVLRLGMVIQLAIGLALVAQWYWRDLEGGWQFGLALALSYPIVWAHLVVLPLIAGRWFVIRPRQRKLIAASERIFREHPGIKLAIAGSYGKTSMKELLVTVLGAGKDVAATPANKNVPVSHAVFARGLTGQEDVVIIEYGEGAPGDVARFARVTHPTHAVVTGIAPAHLDHYKSTTQAAEDIFSVSSFVDSKQLYVNGESPLAEPFIDPSYQVYSREGALGWKVKDVVVSFAGTSFTLHKGKRSMRLHSKLLGRHHIGPLSFAAALADRLGLTVAQIEASIAKTAPFEHRMQPYQLGGAWIIDDTYNGNLEGIRAGTALLGELDTKRKIYVTPGLVDQGKESQQVHTEMGRLIAAAKPDLVVLMENSAMPHIMTGLKAADFTGEIRVEDDPLGFYTSLSSFVAAGDIVLMQNDWTDNYA